MVCLLSFFFFFFNYVQVLLLCIGLFILFRLVKYFGICELVFKYRVSKGKRMLSQIVKQTFLPYSKEFLALLFFFLFKRSMVCWETVSIS